jgi:peptidyl-tRNA hydrolase, PTH1 family
MMMPMQFIFGLGNPGEKYQFSRHNIGFLVLEEVVRQHLASNKGKSEVPFRHQPKLFAEVLKHEDLLFVKPQTYMNESGKAVRATMEYFDKNLHFSAEEQIPQLWVIHDDLDIEVGRYKIQFGTGPKIHNGLRSIDDHLHTDQYWHVRVGVDGRQGDRSVPSQNYVLSSFSAPEKKLIEKVAQEVSIEILRRLAEPI